MKLGSIPIEQARELRELMEHFGDAISELRETALDDLPQHISQQLVVKFLDMESKLRSMDNDLSVLTRCIVNREKYIKGS